MSPGPISGFPELLPAERMVEQGVIDALRATFELNGFAGIETRAAEPVDELLRKGEVDHEIYVLRRLHATAGDAGLGLHYDLTVPFARYVLENAGQLDFPFRRYQIQKAWRGERPQEGRYREFTQADVDVVGRDELPFHHDVEVARVMVEALSALPLPAASTMTLQINNRRLIEGFYRGIGADDPGAVMRVIDKLDKVPADGIGVMLRDDAGLSDRQVGLCLALADIRGSDPGIADRVRGLGVRHELLDAGLAELLAVLAGCVAVGSDRVRVEADLRIARGLDYYTGSVFETRLHGYENLGSICSGGRYDALAADGRSTYPGVGISLGVTRLLVPLLARGAVAATRSVPSAVLVAVAGEASRPASEEVARALRSRGIATEVAAAAVKFGRQIRAAERRGIPYVWFATGGRHEVKDIRSGDQVGADPQTWSPPADDLKPGIVAVD